MWTEIVAAAIKGAVSALMAPLQRWLDRRKDEQTGALKQHATDLEAANQEARDAQGIDHSVAAAGDKSVDERLRRFSRSGP